MFNKFIYSEKRGFQMHYERYHSWRQLSYFFSADNTQDYLLKNYKKKNIPEAEKLSFQNCYPFIYYLTHGKNYYESALQAPLSIKPVLLFYGMIQLVKACILSLDPKYPETTAVLAHGVTTRKRKKQNYEFIDDEVKIQKNGLFTQIASTLFQKEYTDGEKYNMYHLLKRIPELEGLLPKNDRLLQIKVENNSVTIPNTILDSLHMTQDRFSTFLKAFLKEDDVHLLNNNQSFLYYKVQHRVSAPYIYNLFDDSYFLPKTREDFTNFPELLIHYLLLYNLSMICRYETDWWGDLLHSYASRDYPYIHQFLLITAEKVPFLIQQFFFDK